MIVSLYQWRQSQQTATLHIFVLMMQNQQIIPLGEESEEESDSMPTEQQTVQQRNSEQPLSEHVREEDHNIFQSIEKYLEEHCCLKFLLFLIIILLIIAINQEKGYLIKKQRTFKFFIEKIQKEKIKKELISENQDNNRLYVTPTPIPQSSSLQQQQQKETEHPNPPQSVDISIENKQKLEHQSQSSSDQRKNNEQNDQKYQSIEGITMSKIVQAARWRNLKNEDILMHSELSNEEEIYYEQKYKISKYQQLPFCVIVPTFNNVQNNRHISNIQSIVMQNYQNYRIVVIDDASTDGTEKEIREYFQMQTKIKPSNFMIVDNAQNEGSTKNIRKAAIEVCKPEQISIIVDGDDELIGRQVLKLYNTVYQETGAWIVYSNFFTEEGKLGYSKPVPDRIVDANQYRKYPFVTSHLRSLYTQLLRNIKEEDLLSKNGTYFKAASDVSLMLPCLEMAHKRVIYIPELTYLYNEKTGLNNHHLKPSEQKRNERYIRQKAPYQSLDQLLSSNSTLKINTRDELLADPEKIEWFREALRIKNITKDLGNFIDRFSHKP